MTSHQVRKSREWKLLNPFSLVCGLDREVGGDV
jgi:hypothetical protein